MPPTGPGTTRTPTPDGLSARFEVGVTIFFVLSGYLLYSAWVTRLRKGPDAEPVSIPTYFAHRARRILPAYWLTVVGVYLVYLVRENPTEYGAGWGGFWRNMTFTQLFRARAPAHRVDADVEHGRRWPSISCCRSSRSSASRFVDDDGVQTSCCACSEQWRWSHRCGSSRSSAPTSTSPPASGRRHSSGGSSPGWCWLSASRWWLGVNTAWWVVAGAAAFLVSVCRPPAGRR